MLTLSTETAFMTHADVIPEAIANVFALRLLPLRPNVQITTFA
jgi:hypothetical protein